MTKGPAGDYPAGPSCSWSWVRREPGAKRPAGGPQAQAQAQVGAILLGLPGCQQALKRQL